MSEPIDRWLADEADEADAAAASAAVVADPALARGLAERLLIEAQLRRQLRPAGADAVPGARTRRLAARARRGRATSSWRGWATAAAAAALVAIIALAWPRPRPAATPPSAIGATVVATDGARRHHGDAVGPLASGETVGPGDAIEVSTGRVELALAGGAGRVVLRDGFLSWPAAAGDAARLSRGTLEASITHRDPAAPLRFAGPHCEIEIIGTRFALAVEGDTTRLDVSEGRVRAHRPDDDTAVEVAAGGTLRISATGALVPTRLLRVDEAGPIRRFADLPPLQPGDTVVVAAGVHRDRWRLAVSGTAERPITVRGEPGTIVDGAGIELDGGAEPRALIEVTGEHCELDGLTLRNARNHEGNAAGIRVFGVGQAVIRDCAARDCDAGIYIHDVGEAQVERCALVGNGSPGPGGAAFGNLVAERLARLGLRWCELSDARRGDNLWSGATENDIAYCRIARADNAEIDLISAGGASARGGTILGCLIEAKAERPGNRVRLIAFGGADGGRLALVNDTIVSGLPQAQVIEAASPRCSVSLRDCIVAGQARALLIGSDDMSGEANWIVDGCEIPAALVGTSRGAEPGFAAGFALATGSPCVDAGVATTPAPTHEPRDLPRATPRAAHGRIDLGAFEH
jgi:hypothetical protein